MKSVAHELLNIVDEFAAKCDLIPDELFSLKVSPGKWSKKEVIGHLIDSAQNNLRRFICGQYETVPPRIVYAQDFWVNASNYQQMPKDDVIQLWKLLNRQIANILVQMPAENYQKQCETNQLHSIEWLAIDYVKHLKHHLNQVFAGSFDIVYK